MTGPYHDYDNTGQITHADTPDPPVEGVDYVVDTVNSFDGDAGTQDGQPKQMMIRRQRP